MENEKLFSPLNLHLRDKEDAAAGVYDDIHYWRDELSHEEAAGYLDNIEAFLSRDRQRYDNGRGLMEYCPSDILTDKVWSLVPTVERHGGKLWLAADLRLNEPLTDREMADLKSWWGGQLSDGWGEGVEHREIKVDRGELYLEPWVATAGFFIATQEEFARRFGFDYLLPAPAPPAAAREQAAPGPSPETAPAYRTPDKEELEALKLAARLDKNLSEYTDLMMKIDRQDVIGNAKTIAAMQDAHEYLSEEHEFTPDEVAFLLKFQNPLFIVAEHWPTMNGLIDVSRVLPDILKQPITMQKRYALESNAPGAPEEGAPAVSGPEVQGRRGDMDAREFQDKMSALLGGFDKEAMQSLLSYADELEQDEICDADLFFRHTYVEFCLVTRQYGQEISGRLLELFKTFALNPSELRAASHHLNGGADAEQIGQLASDGKCYRTTMEYEEFDQALTDFQDGLLENPGVPKTLSASVDTLKQELFDRLERNLAYNLANLHERIADPDLSREDVLRAAERIVANNNAYAYLTTDYEFRKGDIESLLRFNNPLDAIADEWPTSTAITVVMDAVVHDVLDNQDGLPARPISSGEPPVKGETRETGAEKPSVLDRIREAARAPKEPRGDKPARDKSGPEL